MAENLFYIEKCSSYAVAEMEDDTLILHAIVGDGAVDEVIRAFGSQVMKAIPYTYREWRNPHELYDAMIFVSKAHPTKTKPRTGDTL